VSDYDQLFLWNDIDKLPKVSCCIKVVVVVIVVTSNAFLCRMYPPSILVYS
jgi:hypothetical protein